MVLIGNCETSFENQLRKRIAMYLRREVKRAQGFSQIYLEVANPEVKVIVVDISNNFEKRSLVYTNIREITNKVVIFLVDKNQESLVSLDSMRQDVYFFSKESDPTFLLKLLDEIFIESLKEYSYKGFRVNFEKDVFLIDGRQLPFTVLEQRLCKYLIKNKNIYCSKNKLRREIWGWSKDSSETNINFHIYNVRKKLENYRFLIKNQRGLGYSWCEE